MSKKKRARRDARTSAQETTVNVPGKSMGIRGEKSVMRSHLQAMSSWNDEFPAGAETDFQQHFEESISSLQSEILSHDPIMLLSVLCFENLMATSLESLIPPFAKPKELEQHQLELLQRLLLKNPLDMYKPQLTADDDDVKRLLNSACRAYSIQRLKVAKDKHGQFGEIVGSMQLHTLAIRNFAYPHQFITFVDRLYAPLEQKLQASLGFTASSLVRMLFTIVKLVEERFTVEFNGTLLPVERAKSFSEVAAFIRSNPKLSAAVAILEAATKEQWTIEALQSEFRNWWQTQTAPLIELSQDDFAKCYPGKIASHVLERILTQWSLPFGSPISNVEHLMMANDVWDKPLIRLANGKFLLPIGNLFVGYSSRLIWNAASIDAQIAKALEDRKGDFLEEYVEDLLTTAFPDANILPGVEWSDGVANGENDVVVILPPYMLIAEAKAHRLDIKGRRGAPQSLKEGLKDFVEKPAEQSEGLIKWIKRNPGVQSVKTKRGARTIDCSAVHKFIQLNVTLEDLCPQSSNWQSLADAGAIDGALKPVPSLRVTDLECVLEVLEGQIQKLHYFNRRQEIEGAHIPNDELGWLKLYLENRIMFSPSADFLNMPMLPMFGQMLDGYFLRKDTQLNVPKPKAKLPECIRTALSLLEKDKPHDWVGTGFQLLDLWNEQLVTVDQFVAGIRHGLASKTMGLAQYDCIELGSTQNDEDDLTLCGTLYSSAKSSKDIADRLFGQNTTGRVIVLGCSDKSMDESLIFVQNFVR